MLKILLIYLVSLTREFFQWGCMQARLKWVLSKKLTRDRLTSDRKSLTSRSYELNLIYSIKTLFSFIQVFFSYLDFLKFQQIEGGGRGIEQSLILWAVTILSYHYILYQFEFPKTAWKPEAHGPNRSPLNQVQINKHVLWAKLWLYTITLLGEKTPWSPFLELNGPYLFKWKATPFFQGEIITK